MSLAPGFVAFEGRRSKESLNASSKGKRIIDIVMNAYDEIDRITGE
jgi:hypothetical protein